MRLIKRVIQEQFRHEVIKELINDYDYSVEQATYLFDLYKEPVNSLDSYLVAEDVAELINDSHKDGTTPEVWLRYIQNTTTASNGNVKSVARPAMKPVARPAMKATARPAMKAAVRYTAHKDSTTEQGRVINKNSRCGSYKNRSQSGNRKNGFIR
ncbi:hypothetical protein P4631_07835 [Halalkalibacterium halodurans]|uniref:hypothetical protein n=1 Tax=Halalkalibacterium halodurans TaxID=86665 RepID=UPI002E1ECA6C|nr:hypothetical protein [Halalkalibacterium halodurans]